MRYLKIGLDFRTVLLTDWQIQNSRIFFGKSKSANPSFCPAQKSKRSFVTLRMYLFLEILGIREHSTSQRISVSSEAKKLLQKDMKKMTVTTNKRIICAS